VSLRDLGIFNPLTASHPTVGERCWICRRDLVVGVRVGLKPFESPEEAGGLTVEARVVCGTCLLRGTEISTPEGRRIVDRIADGAEDLVVATTNGKQWRAEEVGP
jgi:hypothetical protein